MFQPLPLPRRPLASFQRPFQLALLATVLSLAALLAFTLAGLGLPRPVWSSAAGAAQPPDDWTPGGAPTVMAATGVTRTFSLNSPYFGPGGTQTFSWTVPLNWVPIPTPSDPPTAPSPGDSLEFFSFFSQPQFPFFTVNDYPTDTEFDSIFYTSNTPNFARAPFSTTGNAIRLTGVISDTSTGGSGFTRENSFKPALVTFVNPTSVTVFSPTQRLRLGNLDFNNNTVTMATTSGEIIVDGTIANVGSLVHTGTGPLTLNGNISGNGTIVHNGPGTLTINGLVSGNLTVVNNGGVLRLLNGGNTYTGQTQVVSGTVTVGGPNALGSPAGGTVVSPGGTVDISANGVTEPFTIAGNGNAPASGALTTSGTTPVLLTGPITLAGDATIANNMALPGTMTINSAIGGSGGLTLACLTPNNDIALGGANTYSGATTLNCNTTVTNGAALGSGATGTTVGAGAALILKDGVTLAEPLSFQAGASLRSTGSAASTLSAPLTLSSDLTVTTDAGLTISGAVGGTAGLTKAGAGTLILSGANTYSGQTTVQQGTLTVANASALGTTGAGTTVNAGAALQLQGNVTVPEPLTLGGTLGSAAGNNTWAGPVTLNNNATVDVPAGQLTISGAVGGGAFGLTKVGAGTLVLTANNTYSGPTNVNVGTLLVNGTQTASPVTVAKGASLGGSGTTGALSANGAAISPGTSPGTLNVGGNFTLGTDLSGGSPVFGTLNVELNGATPGSYDQVNVTGTVTLNSPNLNLSVGFAPPVGTQFKIINNDGSDPVSGTFYSLGQNAQITLSGVTFQINYSGGDGNDVVLTVVNSTGAVTGFPQGNVKFITPVRVLDTRTAAASGNPNAPIGFDQSGNQIAAAQLAAGQTAQYRVAGRTFGTAAQGNQITFPTNTTGVLVNVTLVQGAASGGFVTVFPGDQPAPTASTVNPSTPIAANFWAVALPTTGASAGNVGIRSVGANRDVLLDVVGYFTPDNPSIGNARFINPVRVVDTRSSAASGNIATPIGYDQNGAQIVAGRLLPGQTRRFTLANKQFPGQASAFPADISGIIAHVTLVQDAPSGGFVTLLPGDATGVPGTSTVNPSTATAFNSWAVGVPTTGGAGVAGTIGVYSTNSADVIIDVVGYYAASNPASVGNLTLINPLRAVDTRSAGAASDPNAPIGYDENGNPITAAQLVPGQTRRFTLSGKTFPGGSLPTGVKAVLANVTLVQSAASGGFVTAFPGDVPDASRPNVSTVNPVTAVAASFWANGLPPAGTEAIYSTNQADIIIDIVGYYQ